MWASPGSLPGSKRRAPRQGFHLSKPLLAELNPGPLWGCRASKSLGLAMEPWKRDSSEAAFRNPARTRPAYGLAFVRQWEVEDRRVLQETAWIGRVESILIRQLTWEFR